uniref:ditrans,polycis-polyprenyl diphosphate synthase [(2E,6E)-farnesyldiphosphate specific] n=1 Tax=Amblyomma maculatum TaxID=34609 RepID=G3MT73_AMBMU
MAGRADHIHEALPNKIVCVENSSQGDYSAELSETGPPSVPDETYGNRRYSRRKGIPLVQAYGETVRNLMLMCDWLLRLNIRNITTFLISTRNVNRSSDELEAMLKTTDRFCSRTICNINGFQQRGLRHRWVGELESLPDELSTKAAQLELGTSGIIENATCTFCIVHNSKRLLNRMAGELARAVRKGVIRTEDITSGLIDDYLAIAEVPECDLWFRSSGEVRFSELIAIQSGYAYVHFEPKLWLSVRFWEFVQAILAFQIHWPSIKTIQKKHFEEQESRSAYMDLDQTIRQRAFLRHVEMKRMEYIHQLSTGLHCKKREK